MKNLVFNPLLKIAYPPIRNLQRARLLNPSPQLLTGTLGVTLLRSGKHGVVEIGEQRDDVIPIIEAVEFAAECLAPLHCIDLETGVLIENDTVHD